MKGIWKNKKFQEKKFSFPPEEELKKLLKRVEESNYRRVNIGLHPNATPAEKAKYKLCKTIARYERENELSEQELGKKLGIDQTKTEYILFCHIDKLHLDELINYADNLHLPFKLIINGLHANQKTTAEAY